jgi:hypothetical protein
MATEQRKMPARMADLASEYNRTLFLIRQVVEQTVSTAIPVRVDSVERSGDGSGAGYLSATPLVAQTDADGNLIPPVSIPKLPYFRLQHGTAAVICDPVPGDIGLAVFAQADCSRLNGGGEPVVPGTRRAFDMSDGFYIGGFWGKAPEVFIHLEQAGTIEIEAPQAITIKAERVSIEAEALAEIKAPQIVLDGAITGGGSGGLDATFTGDVTAQGVSLVHHTHGGVSSGPDDTGEPNGGGA